jgi:hemerythrin
MFFEWNSHVELGHPLIDEQHRRLFSLSEAVAQSLAGSPAHRPTEAALRALIDFVREHFATEEGLMRGAGFPETAEHARLHDLLLAELDAYCRKVRQEDNAGLTLTGLVAFLWHWLVMHINVADRELVEWLRAREGQREGSAPR